MGGIKNYKFGQKNIWRRWAWNRVEYYSKRINKNPKDMLGIYLIGEGDDLGIALQKGFKRENLIGIDVDEEKVKKNRKNGFISINSKIQDVLRNWCNEPQIDFIMADFCCGLTKQMSSFLVSISLSYGVNDKTLILINSMRGRDLVKYQVKDEKNEKHRGKIILFILNDLLKAFENVKDVDFNPISFYSYKSIVNKATLVFDSICFKWPIKKEYYYTTPIDKNVFNKISAAKAIRSMRVAA